jgi:hypothetical protein
MIILDKILISRLALDAFSLVHLALCSELTTVVKFLGLRMTEDEVQAMFDEFDEDKSGSIEFDEFLILISKKVSGPQDWFSFHEPNQRKISVQFSGRL